MSALWWFLALVGLLGYIWLRNFWPEWALYRLGKTLGIPQADLVAKRCVRERLLMVHAELQQKYIAFVYRLYDLIYTAPDAALRAELTGMMQIVSEHGNPDPETWSTVNEVLERISEIGALSMIAGEIAIRSQAWDLENLYADYQRIERRIGLPEAEEPT